MPVYVQRDCINWSRKNAGRMQRSSTVSHRGRHEFAREINAGQTSRGRGNLKKDCGLVSKRGADAVRESGAGLYIGVGRYDNGGFDFMSEIGNRGNGSVFFREMQMENNRMSKDGLQRENNIIMENGF